MRRNAHVAVFTVSRREMVEMILIHRANVLENIERIRSEMPAEEKGSEAKWGTRVTTVREICQNAIEALDRKAQEALYLADHVGGGWWRRGFEMSAAELLAFRKEFSCITVNVERMVLSAMTAASPDRQAERHLSSTVAQVPRLVLPGGMQD